MGVLLLKVEFLNTVSTLYFAGTHFPHLNSIQAGGEHNVPLTGFFLTVLKRLAVG